MYDELKTFSDILRYSLNYHHWQATSKSRTAYRVGKQLGGDQGLVLQPHIDIMAATLPKRSRKPKPPVTTPPAQTPPQTNPPAQ